MCLSPVQSHPTWVRGLKPSNQNLNKNMYVSHPTWVRGLKLGRFDVEHYQHSRTLRGCVD